MEEFLSKFSLPLALLETFRQNEIQLLDLPLLSESQLERLGLSMGLRVRIMKEAPTYVAKVTSTEKSPKPLVASLSLQPTAFSTRSNGLAGFELYESLIFPMNCQILSNFLCCSLIPSFV